MTDEKHTEGQLFVGENPDGYDNEFLYDADGVQIACADHAGTHKAKANAERLALAWNCHDELVEACRGLIRALRAQAQLAKQMGGDIALREGNYEAWQAGEAALAKTEGKG